MAEKIIWKQKLNVMRYYNTIASIYDDRYRREQDEKINVALQFVGIGRKSLVLDVGCGTGILLDHLKNSTQKVIGVDIAVNALKMALRRPSYHSKVNLLNVDADHMPFPDEIFDTVFAVTLLQNMPEPERTICEIMRVSKPDATLVITGLKKAFTLETFVEILRRAGLTICVLKTGENVKEYIAVCKKR
ncbi:TPA: class I SAM-dependent methyltransferase [Candidatus Bathyarchaeota archaeon]|nr:class I SAM-dependent methyltransferase [Candidatus Bathyarchaeota archaeon]